MKFCIYSNSDVFLKIHLVAYFGGWFHPCWWVSSVDITGLEFQPVRSGEVWRSLGCDPWHRQHGGARLHEGGNAAVLDAVPFWTWVLKKTWRFPFWKMGVPPVLSKSLEFKKPSFGCKGLRFRTWKGWYLWHWIVYNEWSDWTCFSCCWVRPKGESVVPCV